MSGRAAFVLIASAVLAIALFTAVLRPAIERGGAVELIGLGAAVAAILLAERWLRGR